MTRPDVCPDCHWGCESCYDAGRDAGRRETLWLMAVGAAVESELATFVGEMDTTTRYYVWVTMHAVSQDALALLSDMGDETASRMLRGEA